jgi:hypothetical protein
MAMPRAVHRDERGELVERAQATADMERAWQHAKVLMDNLAAARRRATAMLN